MILQFAPVLLFLQAVRLESAYPQVTRYMVVVSTNGRQDTEESIVLGMDFVSSDRYTFSVLLWFYNNSRISVFPMQISFFFLNWIVLIL